MGNLMIGDKYPSTINVGVISVSKIMCGTEQVWPKEQLEPILTQMNFSFIVAQQCDAMILTQMCKIPNIPISSSELVGVAYINHGASQTSAGYKSVGGFSVPANSDFLIKITATRLEAQKYKFHFDFIEEDNNDYGGGDWHLCDSKLRDYTQYPTDDLVINLYDYKKSDWQYYAESQILFVGDRNDSHMTYSWEGSVDHWDDVHEELVDNDWASTEFERWTNYNMPYVRSYVYETTFMGSSTTWNVTTTFQWDVPEFVPGEPPSRQCAKVYVTTYDTTTRYSGTDTIDLLWSDMNSTIYALVSPYANGYNRERFGIEMRDSFNERHTIPIPERFFERIESVYKDIPFNVSYEGHVTNSCAGQLVDRIPLTFDFTNCYNDSLKISNGNIDRFYIASGLKVMADGSWWSSQFDLNDQTIPPQYNEAKTDIIYGQDTSVHFPPLAITRVWHYSMPNYTGKLKIFRSREDPTLLRERPLAQIAKARQYICTDMWDMDDYWYFSMVIVPESNIWVISSLIRKLGYGQDISEQYYNGDTSALNNDIVIYLYDSQKPQAHFLNVAYNYGDVTDVSPLPIDALYWNAKIYGGVYDHSIYGIGSGRYLRVELRADNSMHVFDTGDPTNFVDIPSNPTQDYTITLDYTNM